MIERPARVHRLREDQGGPQRPGDPLLRGQGLPPHKALTGPGGPAHRYRHGRGPHHQEARGAARPAHGTGCPYLQPHKPKKYSLISKGKADWSIASR
eukprot:scaffold131698_cov34-Prasinocladus_malaysianus.AAC.1